MCLNSEPPPGSLEAVVIRSNCYRPTVAATSRAAGWNRCCSHGCLACYHAAALVVAPVAMQPMCTACRYTYYHGACAGLFLAELPVHAEREGCRWCARVQRSLICKERGIPGPVMQVHTPDVAFKLKLTLVLQMSSATAEGTVAEGPRGYPGPTPGRRVRPGAVRSPHPSGPVRPWPS